MGVSTTADRSMIDRRSKAYFYEKIDVAYEDNRGKLRFTIKVKMHLRFTRNGPLRIYEDNKSHLRFTKIINRRLRFTKIPLVRLPIRYSIKYMGLIRYSVNPHPSPLVGSPPIRWYTTPSFPLFVGFTVCTVLPLYAATFGKTRNPNEM